MFKIISAAIFAISAGAVASLAAPPAGRSTHDVTTPSTLDDVGAFRFNAAGSITTSPVTIAVAARPAARPAVASIAHASQSYTSCSVRELIQGSGSVQTCETVVVR